MNKIRSGAPASAWMASLAELSPVLDAAIGSWLPRLAALVGPTLQQFEEPEGDPDGYGDLARRGSYERLAISEWAVARALPLEFMRRAAMGEHLFLELQRRRQRGGRRIVVVFDAGPDQLGSPRLAHIAWLLVLAERARRSAAEFRWFVLQDALWMGEGSAREDIEALLRARSRKSGGDRIETWREHLEEIAVGEERWWIGGEDPKVRNRERGEIFVTIQEPWEQQVATALEVAVTGGGMPRRRCRLELPETRIRRQVLRGQLDAALSTHFSILPSADRVIAFSASGDRVIHDLEDGRLIAHHLPKRPSDMAGKPRYLELPPDEELVAVGFQGRRFLSVSVLMGQDSAELRLRGVGTRSQRQRGSQYLTAQAPADLSIPGKKSGVGRCWKVKDDQGTVLFLDAANQLFRFQPFTGKLHFVAGEVMAVTGWRGELFVVLGEADPIPRGGTAGGIARWKFPGFESFDVADPIGGRAFIGWSGRPQSERPLIGVEKQRGVFRFVSRPEELHNSQSGTVVGVGDGPSGRAGLLVVEEDRQTLRHLGVHFDRELWRSEVAIRQVETTPVRPIVAVTQENGQVQVLSLKGNRTLFTSEARE